MVTFSNTFTTTKWVVNGVHSHTTHRWSLTEPTGFSGFTNANILMICVSDLTNRSPAV